MQVPIYDYSLTGPLWWAAVVVNVAAVAVAGKQALRLNRGSVHRGLRRVAIRCGWPSIARSVGLAVNRDKKVVVAGTATTAATTKTVTVERLPKLSHGRASATKAAVTWRVRPARGQSLDDVAARSDELAAAMHVRSVLVERAGGRPDRGTLTAVLADELGVARPWPGPGSGVGVTASGDVLHLPLIAGHYLIAGETGSGKSSWMNAVLADLVTSGTPRYIVGVDPKVVELSAWAPALDRLIVDPAEASEALAAVHRQVTDRYRTLQQLGLRKLEQPTAELPLIVVVVDELGELARQGPGEAKTAPQERLRILASLAAIGRGAGCVLVCCTQRPSAQLIGADLRANLVRRICCRVPDEFGGEAVLGPPAAQLAPWLIPPADKGVAWVQAETLPAPTQARAWWVSDDDIAAIAAAHPAPRPAQLEAVKA